MSSQRELEFTRLKQLLREADKQAEQERRRVEEADEHVEQEQRRYRGRAKTYGERVAKSTRSRVSRLD
jgi:hypothetical protein